MKFTRPVRKKVAHALCNKTLVRFDATLRGSAFPVKAKLTAPV